MYIYIYIHSYTQDGDCADGAYVSNTVKLICNIFPECVCFMCNTIFKESFTYGSVELLLNQVVMLQLKVYKCVS